MDPESFSLYYIVEYVLPFLSVLLVVSSSNTPEMKEINYKTSDDDHSDCLSLFLIANSKNLTKLTVDSRHGHPFSLYFLCTYEADDVVFEKL
jgi:ferric iron reductase protein FhuF